MDYNQQCDAMFAAGKEWIDAHPDHKAAFKSLGGHRFPDNDDARSLLEAMTNGVEGTSGNQVQMVLSALLDQ